MESESKMGAAPGAGTPEEMDRLDGWKEIAAYMRVSVKTAQRWADELGFPAYKIGGKVRATKGSVDAWEVRFATSGAAPLRLLAANG